MLAALGGLVLADDVDRAADRLGPHLGGRRGGGCRRAAAAGRGGDDGSAIAAAATPPSAERTARAATAGVRRLMPHTFGSDPPSDRQARGKLWQSLPRGRSDLRRRLPSREPTCGGQRALESSSLIRARPTRRSRASRRAATALSRRRRRRARVRGRGRARRSRSSSSSPRRCRRRPAAQRLDRGVGGGAAVRVGCAVRVGRGVGGPRRFGGRGRRPARAPSPRSAARTRGRRSGARASSPRSSARPRSTRPATAATAIARFRRQPVTPHLRRGPLRARSGSCRRPAGA